MEGFIGTALDDTFQHGAGDHPQLDVCQRAHARVSRLAREEGRLAKDGTGLQALQHDALGAVAVKDLAASRAHDVRVGARPLSLGGRNGQ